MPRSAVEPSSQSAKIRSERGVLRLKPSTNAQKNTVMAGTLSSRLLTSTAALARRLPASVTRLFARPIGYRLSTADAFVHESARMIHTAFGYCRNNKVEGDYAEFGVYRGRGIIEADRASRLHGLSDRQLWAFDSFSGLPEVTGVDEGGPFTEGEFFCSRPEFERNLRRAGIPSERFRIVEGFFDETLLPQKAAELGLEQVAVAWIDCDLYESTIPVLDFLTDRLVDGAVLIFDDWYCFNGGMDRGERRACAEWLSRNPQLELMEYQKFHWAGNSFIVSRREGPLQ